MMFLGTSPLRLSCLVVLGVPTLLAMAGPIVVRRSTDIFAFEDEHVAAAMRTIHERAGDGLGMKQLMNETTVSRKWLDPASICERRRLNFLLAMWQT